MGMGFALRQVNPLLHMTTLTTVVYFRIRASQYIVTLLTD